MKKASHILLMVLLFCLCSMNKVKCDSLDPDLSVLRSTISYRDFGIVNMAGIYWVQEFDIGDDGWLLIINVPGFIQTKSSASLNLASSDKSLLTAKAINKIQEGDIYKYDIQLVYNGSILEQNDYKGTSQIMVEQDSNEEYQSTSLSFQLKFEQREAFAAQILPYDETMGTVDCNEAMKAPFGYLLHPEYCKSITFTFYSKKGYRLKEVKVNGVSLGKIGSYVAKVGKNYLIEPIWEKYDPVTHTVKVTYSAGGSVKVNDQSITSGQSTTVTASTNVKVMITPQIGYHIQQIKLGNEDVTNLVSDNMLIIPSISANKEITVTFEKDTSVTHIVKVTYSAAGSVKVNNQFVTSGQLTTVTASTDVKVTIIPQMGYYIKQVLLGNDDVTDQLSDNILIISSISTDKNITVIFEKEDPLTYTVKITYSGEGSVMVNDQSVTSVNPISVPASSNVKVTITPQIGYYIKQVLLGNDDVTDQLNNNVLTISSISTNKDVTIIFEKDISVTHSVKVTYSLGGSVMVNNQSVTTGQSVTATASTDVEVTIMPHPGYRILQVELGGKDVTDKLSGNLLTISSLSEDKEIKITFVRTTYVLSVTYSEGGYVVVGKNGGGSKKFASGESETFRAFDVVDVRITPETGYRIKQILLGNVDVTDRGYLISLSYSNSKIVTDQKITVIFEKITYSVKVTYSDGGSIEVNDLSVASGNTYIADIFTDVKVKIIPNKGYRLREVKVGMIDVTDQVKDNILTIPSIYGNKEIMITFSYILKVYSSGSGSIKVNDEIIQSGSIVSDLDTGTKLEFIPDEGYYMAKVTLNSQDITSELIDNSYTISSLPSYSSLSVTFKTFPTYELNIDMPRDLASIKIDDKVITESTRISDIKKGSSILINFQPSKYYEIKKVTLGDEDITSQIQDGSYEIKSIKSNLTLKVEYVRKQYTLSVNIQGTDKIKINRKEVINGSSIIINSGYNQINISSEYYLIKQVLLDDKIVYQDRADVISYSASIEDNVDCDKKLTIIAELREKREISLTLEEPGTLASHLSEEDIRMVTDLNINGEIDQRDFLVMNQMQSLYNLSLRGVTIRSYNNYPANTIPEKAFYNNKTIKMIYPPNSIEAIGKQAFLGSAISNLEGSAESYKYLTKIGEESFKDCQYLIYIPSLYNISVIEKGTFENCSNLTSVFTILPNLVEIKESAFRNCKNLSITLESGLKRIGDYALENVKYVSIPSWQNEKFELSYIGINALKGCQNDIFDFKNCPNLKELPCFEGCDKLVSILFPPNIKEVSTGTFKGCTSLQYVEMNENIERIAENAFNDKFIAQLCVPVTKTPEVYANSFNDFIYDNAKLLVPVDQLPFYQIHPVWGKFKNIKPLGTATYRLFKVTLSEGGWISLNDIYTGDNGVWSRPEILMFPTSSCMKVSISPDNGYSIESVYLNGENVTNALDENNIYVIPYLLVDSHLEVKFKQDNTTGSERINTNKRVYLSGTNQLSLSGFRIGAHVFVYDAGGRLVIQTIIRDQLEKIGLPGRGLYFIRIDNESFKIIF